MINFTRTSAGRIVLMAGAVLLAGLTGCNRSEIRSYEVAKEGAPAAGQMTAMPHNHPMGGRPTLSWKTPAGWSEGATSEMRLGSFTIHEGGHSADVSIVPLGGAAGGDVPNVNRWRGQLGLDPLGADELKASAEKVEVAGQPADLYDISGQLAGEPSRILGAIQHRGGTAWFFKMTGDESLVAAQKPVFVNFLKSVTFGAPAPGGHAHSPAEMGTLPDGHPPIGGSTLPDGHPPIGGTGGLPAGHPETSSAPAAASSSVDTSGQPAWQPPSSWRQVPGGPFLVAKFMIGADSASQAAVNVSMSAGDGGGFVSNINRWRTQIGLNQLPEAEINRLATSVDVTGGQARFVDMSGTDPQTGRPTRVVGAMVPRAGQTWFYKLAGDSRLVEAEKESFTKFVQSVKY